MSLDLSFDDAQAGIAAMLSQFCKERRPVDVVKASAGSFPTALWRDLAGLGVLALATPEGEGGACEVVAAMETLGSAVFPGPLAASFFAVQVLPADERIAVAEGRSIVAVGRPPLLPFAPVATVFLEIEGETVHRLRPRGEIERVDTLGGEIWGRVDNVTNARYATGGAFNWNAFADPISVQRFVAPGAPIGGWGGVKVRF